MVKILIFLLILLVIFLVVIFALFKHEIMDFFHKATLKDRKKELEFELKQKQRTLEYEQENMYPTYQINILQDEIREIQKELEKQNS